MTSNVVVKSYPQTPIDISEAIRYAGGGASDEVLALAESCAEEINGRLRGAVCYAILDVEISEDVCDFGVFKVNSKNLAKNLLGVKRAILFGATVGVEIDRLIAKYSRLSPSKALFIQALGAERIEALCDRFEEDIKKELASEGKTSRMRFSPGYGDLPLSLQKEIFAFLRPEKIGISLGEGLLMTPTKSVTAIIGIKDGTK
jgi:hypothetical protein